MEDNTIKTKLVTLNELSDGDKFRILRTYISNTKVKDIAKEHNVPLKTIETFIAKFYKEFCTSRELHNLIANFASLPTYNKRFKKPSYIADELVRLIEEEHADLVYAHSYYLTKNNVQALKEAGLYDINRTYCASDTNSNADKLKGQYLRSIPRVKEELKKLREENLKDSNINPDYIKAALVEQIEQLESFEDLGVKERQVQLRALELLGKSIGAYSDKITVETINPNDVLDKLLIEAEEIKDLPKVYTTYTSEDLDDEEY